MADQKIVTEIIVDSRAAEEGLAVVAAGMRAAQREFDRTTAKSRENTAANKAAAESGKDVADVLTTTAASLRKAAAESQAYRGRLDPLVFAQTALAKELGNVGRAIIGVDTLLVAGKMKGAEATKQVEEFKARQAELVGVLDQVKGGTIKAADAMTYLKTAAERAAEPIKAVAAATDTLRLKYDESYRSQKQYADATKRIFEELASGNITRQTAILGLKQETEALKERDAASARAKGGTSEAEAARLQALRAKYDDVFRVAKQYKDTLTDIRTAETQAGLASDVANQQREKARKAMEESIATIKKGSAGPSAADAAAEYQKLRSSIDPVYKLSKEYQAQVDHITESQKILKLSTEQLDQAYENARLTFEGQVNSLNRVRKGHEETDESMKKTGASVGQLKFANQQLTVQMSQFISGVATGQPILMTLIQQGHQVADVMWASGISMKEMAGGAAKMLGSALALLVTPIGLIVTGLTAVIGTMALLAVNAESAARSFGALKVTLSATRGDFDDVATDIEKNSRRIAASLRLSREEVTSTMGAIAALPLPAGLNSSLEDLTRTAANLGTVLGTGLAGGLKSVSAALQDPTKAAQAFANTEGGLRSLSGALLRNIVDLQNAGDKVGATNVLLGAMKVAADIAEKQGLTPLQQAMKALNEEFTKGSEKGKNFFKDLGDGITGALAGAVLVLKDLVSTINKLYELSEKLPKGTVGAATSLIPGVGPFIAAYTTGSALYDTLFNRGNGTGGLVGTPTAQTQALIAKWQQDPMAVRSALSSANAIGIGQLMPGTAAGLNVNPMVPLENVKGMMLYIQQLAKDFPASPDIAAHYLTGPAGAGRGSAAGSKYANETMARDPSSVPTDTAAMIEYWGQFYGMPREMIDLGKRIAMQENRGKQGPLSVMRPYIDPTTASSVGAKVTVAPTDIDPLTGKPRVGANKDTDAGLSQVRAYTAAIEALKVQQRELDKARGEGAVTEKEHAMRTAQITLAIARETDKMMEANKASQNAIEVSKQLTEADATMLRNRQAMQDQMRNDPTITQEQATKRLAEQEAELAGSYNRTVIELDKKLKADTLEAEAQARGVEGVARAAAAQQALNEVNKSFTTDSPERARALDTLTQKYLEAATAQQKINLEKEKVANQETIKVLGAETEALHMQADAGALYVQHVKNAIAVRKEYFGQSPEVQAAALKERDAIAALNQELNNQRAIGQYLAGQFDTMFSTIGNAISQAFVQGQGAAVNWGNVTKAVISQVQQMLIQLAIINPLKQMFLGSSVASAPTLSNVFGYLGGGGTGSGASGGASGGGSSGGGLFGLLGNAGSSVSSGSSLYSMFTGKSLTEGMFSSTGFFGSGGTAANFLATPIWGSVSGTATNTALAGMGGQFGPATASAYTAAGGAVPTTLGSLAGAAGGVAAGFALGTMAGQGIQGMRGTTGPAPMAGAAAGAIAGAVIGTVVPVIGTVVGAIIGGIIGGGAGGFIGPKKASPYSSTLIDISDGHASLGQTLGQGVDTTAERASILDDITKLNTYLDSTSLKLTGLGKVAQIGQNSPGGFQDPSKFGNIAAGFGELRFGSADPTLNKYLTDRSFGDSEALQNAIKGYRELVDTTIPTLMAFGKTTGSVNDSIKQLNDAFNAGIAKAKEYGIATDDLVKAQAEGEAKIREQANNTIASVDFQFRMRKRIAEGGDPQSIELDNFDQGAKEQRDAFKAQMVGLFGDAFTSTTYYADQMKLLEETLGAERASIVKKYADQIIAQEKQLRQINENLDVRAMNASSASDQDKALFGFDVRARQEREAFGDSLIGIYGDAYKKTQAYADEMKRLESVQGAERVAIVKQYAEALKQAEQGISRGDDALRVRLMNATPGDDIAKKLYAFDIQAQQEREDYSRGLLQVYGDAYATSADYASHIALLEKTLGAERLAIVNESNDAIAQKTKDAQASAASAIQSLVNYATGLQTSTASPLSQQDQYTLARNKFNAVAGAAAAGDYNSIQQLQSYSDSFLNTSRGVYGSGEVYASDFQRVLDALNQVASVAPDTLTASVLATETRTQTAELVSSLADLKAAVETITTQLRQNATAPARIAA